MTTQTLTLGTPLSPAAVRVMLLGSGELGKEVLIALQRLGVETLAVDRYENAPGQQVAHHAHTLTMSDGAALRALIEREKPDLIVPEIEAIATSELQALEAEGLVRVIPTARAARLTMDREGIRRLAAETLALPTSPYVFCDSLAELQAAIDGTGASGKPAASAVIYGGVDAKAVRFEGVAEALRVPQTELRLFGKPESFVKRRLGVALAHDADVERARRLAKEAAGKVVPKAVD